MIQKAKSQEVERKRANENEEVVKLKWFFVPFCFPMLFSVHSCPSRSGPAVDRGDSNAPRLPHRLALGLRLVDLRRLGAKGIATIGAPGLTSNKKLL